MKWLLSVRMLLACVNDRVCSSFWIQTNLVSTLKPLSWSFLYGV